MGDDTPSDNLSVRLRAAIGAWQPFTGRGVAAFARASGGRVLVFQVFFAAIAAVAVVWSLRTAWFPVIQRALAELPAADAGVPDAGIKSREFHWPDTNAVLLANSPHLALVADPAAAGDLGQNGDVQVELRPRELRFRGLLGQAALPYPANLDLPLDRTGATAAWGAWRLPVLGLVALGSFASLLVTWWLLAAAYTPIAGIAAWLGRRPLSLAGAWRLAATALLPAALLMAFGIMLYAAHWIRLPGLAAVCALHFLAGWLWAAWGVAALPRAADPTLVDAPNPFQPEATGAVGRRAPAATRNPFGG